MAGGIATLPVPYIAREGADRRNPSLFLLHLVGGRSQEAYSNPLDLARHYVFTVFQEAEMPRG